MKADAIIREAEEKAHATLAQAKSKAQVEADETLSRARVEADALKRSILSSRIRANRLRLLEEKNRIVQSVLQSVEEKLASMASDEKFEGTLKRFVTEAVDAVGVEQPTVRLGFRELSKKQLDQVCKSLSKGPRIVIEDQPIDGLGGVVASDSDGRIVYNNSFRARLDRFDNQLLTVISSTIFGE